MGYPEQASIMEYILLAIVAAGFLIVYGRIWLGRRRKAPLRREVRAQNVTFRTSLNQVKMQETDGRWLALNSVMGLFVRDDAFDISSLVPLFRIVMGMEYYFKARETSTR
jgi:hypothetical protein